MKFYKYHGLGNDYIVMNPKEIGRNLTKDEIIRICHRNFGVGSDGILWGPLETKEADFRVRIFNPDASEAEKSGNGLRIFSRYLLDHEYTKVPQFSIDTIGGIVNVEFMENDDLIKIEMGKASFDSEQIPVEGPRRDVINESMIINEQDYRFCAVTVGNPHCVLHLDEISKELAHTLGPLIENDSRFPNRTNVQFLKILDRNNIQIEIWERGAGYTLASGSSSSAAAAVAYKLGYCDSDITVHMPGGELTIQFTVDFDITMTGPVTRVLDGKIDQEIFLF